jgi:hypothetical protein
MATLTTNKSAQSQSRSVVPFLTQCLSRHVNSATLCESVSVALRNIASSNKQWVVGVVPALRATVAKHTEAACPRTAALLSELGDAGSVKYNLSESNRASLNELGLSDTNEAARRIAMPAIQQKANRAGRYLHALQLARSAPRTATNNSLLEPLVNRVSGETFASERKRSRRTNRKRATRRRKN